MLTTPLEVRGVAESLELDCFYFVQAFGSRRPHVAWYFNELYSADEGLHISILGLDERHTVKTSEIVCRENYMQNPRSHCYKSTITIRQRTNEQRPVVYTCEVWMSKADGSLENRLTVDYRIGGTRDGASKWIYEQRDMELYGSGCDRVVDKLVPLETLIQEFNACERNAFLRLWISPPNGENSVRVKCSHPIYVVFDKVLRLYRLPADSNVIALLLALRGDNSTNSQFDSIIKEYGELLLESEVKTLRFGGDEHRIFDPVLHGNVSLDCQLPHVIMCVYAPIFQLRLIHPACAIPVLSDYYYSDSGIIWIGICSFLVVATLLVICSYLYLRQLRNRHGQNLWKRVKARTDSLRRIINTPPTPTSPAPSVNSPSSKIPSESASVFEYMKLDEKRWPISARNLRLEERIASGSYGDIFKGVLLGSLPGQEELTPHPIVAKMLNDIYLTDHVVEFVNEVAIRRLIGAHPTIVQFLGCAQRTNLSNRPVLVTEYAPRGMLSAHLRSLRLGPDTALSEVIMTYWWTRARTLVADLFSFAIDIASALVYLQGLGVVHGDVSARNVLLSTSFTAKLNDFGLASVIPPGEFAELPANKRVPVRWSPPEVLHENRRHARSDVWSFGVLLWEIFELGVTPYWQLQTESAVEAFITIEDGRLPRPALAPTTLYSLMTDCWAASVDERPDFHTVSEALSTEASRVAREGKRSDADNLCSHSYLPMELHQMPENGARPPVLGPIA